MKKIQALMTLFFVVVIVSADSIGTVSFAAPTETRGAITIAFDDGEQSLYDYAFPLMQDRGINATFYVITDAIRDFSNSSAFMSIAELQTLQDYGCEIASHSKTHPAFTDISDSQIREECNVSKQVLQSYGFSADNFAYPYGSRNNHTDSIVAEYYRSARSAYAGPYIMQFPVSQFLLPGFAGETGDSSVLPRLESMVDEVYWTNGWAIILFHRVLPDVYNDPYGISSQDFESFLDYIIYKGVSTITVNQGLDSPSPPPERPVPDWTNVTQDFFTLNPGTANPVLTKADITDRTNVTLVADPFLFHEDSTWYMFFEIGSNNNNLDCDIGLATSSDGLHWTYQQVVLDEPFHLAYPQVFKWEGTYYMIPETYSQDQVKLYKATSFPYTWAFVANIISGPGYVDSSIFRYNNTWWLFTSDYGDSTYLYYYDELTDPPSWRAHPMNPIVSGDASKARGGGRVTVFNGTTIIRLTQKSDVVYGQAVRGFQVDTLTSTAYAEHEIPQSPIVQASGSGWNKDGMHTVDPWWTGNGWLAAVDGVNYSPSEDWSIGIYVTHLQVTITPAQVKMYVGESHTFNSSVTGGAPPYTYQWYLNDTAVSGATGSNWTFTPATTGHYKVYLNVTDSLNSKAQSNVVTDIVVYPQPVSVYHTFSVDPASRDDYGLAYPVTYEFSIPNGVSNLKAYRRFALEENWVQIVEKTSNDFFNGIEAVRFDHANNRAYVSASFASYSDCIYLYFADSEGNEVSTTYLGITEYYDDRRVAVVFTIDDLGAPPPWGGDYVEVSTVFADAEVWWTGGIVTTWIDSWQSLQECVNRGYFEAASHSRNHPAKPPYDDYDWEIGGSRDDIIANLNLPNLYKKGSKEYVWCWIEPNGESDDMVQQKLGEYNYLISRSCNGTNGPTYYEQWNSVFGIYDRAWTSAYMDYKSLAQINYIFDSVYAAGGIYHAWGHVGQLDWGPGGKGHEHVQYVKGKKDVWYVGFGALYAYDYTRMHVKYMSVAITPTQVKMYVGQAQMFSSSVLGGTPPFSYQWYLNDTAVSGATGSNWTFTPATTGHYKVYLNVTDSLNSKAQSNVVTDIVVYPQLTVSISPVSVNMTVGTSQTFSSTVSGGTPPYTYQWYLNGTAVAGATSSAWAFTPSSAGTYVIYLRVADGFTAVEQSDNATATVGIAVTVAPTQVKMYIGQSQTFSSSVLGGTPPYTYQWFLNDTAVPGATGATWVFTPRSEGFYRVYVNVTDGADFRGKSNVAAVLACSVYLVMTVDSSQGKIARGQSVTVTVDVFNKLDPVLESSLTLTVTGPRNCGYFDVQPICVPAGTVREYSFTWAVPNVAGAYTVEVGLVPAQLTAYDAVWLNVT